MKIRLTQDVARTCGKPALRVGVEYNVIDNTKIGPDIGGKPGYLTIDTRDGEELVIFSQEFEIVKGQKGRLAR